MYEAHFGLRENPFSSSPSPEFIYQSREHREALAHFQYAITNREPFVLLTGEVGTGKTTSIQALRRLLPAGAPVAFVAHTTLEPRELIEEIALRFGLDPQPGESKPALMHRLEAYLEDRLRAGGQALLVFDEAHLMSMALLEEVRLLSNLESPRGGKLLQICLVGQPELERHLQSAELRQLRQRISVRYSLHPLSREDTGAYIHHRLRAAGCPNPEQVFPADAVAAVHGLSQGIPREINVLAGQALLNAYLDDAPAVARAHVFSAKSDYGFQGIVTGAASLSMETPVPPVPRRVPAAESMPPIEPPPATPPRRPIPVPPDSLRPPARPSRPPAPASAQPPASAPRTAPIPLPPRGKPAKVRVAGARELALPSKRPRRGRAAWILGAVFVAIVALGLAVLLRDRAPVGDDMMLQSTASPDAGQGMVRGTDSQWPRTPANQGPSAITDPDSGAAADQGSPAVAAADSAGASGSVDTAPVPREEPAAVNPPVEQVAARSTSPPPPVETAAQSDRPPGMSDLVAIQVASFRTRRRAEEVLAEVTASTHLRGAVIATEVNGTTWQRLLLGAFHSEAEAREAAQPLLRNRTISTVVVRPIPLAWVTELAGQPQP